MVSANPINTQSLFGATAPQASQAVASSESPVAGSQTSASSLDDLFKLLDQMTAKKKSTSTQAFGYLKKSGIFDPRPLEKQVKVSPPDDSGYWSALGYDA